MNEMLMKVIDQLLQEIAQVTDLLYQQKVTEGYKRLDNLLAHIMTTVDELYSYKSSAAISFDESALIHSLTEAMKAMEENDSVLLADILSLKIAEQLEKFKALI